MNDSPIAVIADGSTGAIVPAISDAGTNRLAVDARLNDGAGNYASVVRDGQIRRLSVDVRGSGVSGSQMVNQVLATSGGSTTIHTASGTAASPVRFFYSPASGTVTITRLAILLEGTNFQENGSSLMGAAALANGIQIGVTVGGSTYVLATIKVNEDLILSSNGSTFTSAPGGSLLTIQLGTVYMLQGVYPLAQPLTTSDSIFVSVRDNLNAIGNVLLFAKANVQGYSTS